MKESNLLFLAVDGAEVSRILDSLRAFTAEQVYTEVDRETLQPTCHSLYFRLKQRDNHKFKHVKKIH